MFSPTDLPVVGGRVSDPNIRAVMLDTDYLVCVMSNNNPLSKRSMVTLEELRRERMILRLPNQDLRRSGKASLLTDSKQRDHPMVQHRHTSFQKFIDT